MPLLDIATAQPSFQNNTFTLGARTLLRNKIVFGNEKRLASGWKFFQVPVKEKNLYMGGVWSHQGVLVIRAVATLGPKCPVRKNDGHGGCDNLQLGVDSRSSSRIQQQSSSEDTEDLDEREKLRRMRISKANKGNKPWNKGRKHSAETLQRIRERTRLAMQDPKVKMKLVNLGHAQSKETRIKIGVGVRMGWERRREKLMLQETCYFEWQNYIAEASRRGFVGEEELQWDSYKILDEQLEQEWLKSVEQRKKMPRSKGCRRAPKSLEQRRKISEAISAKWADPAYRDRVYSALSKYHGTPVGAQRKLRRRPSGESQTRTRSPPKKKAENTDNSSGNVTKIQKEGTRLRRSNVPLYKDPLASSKLEMIKNIRAQRAAAETKKTEAIEQAKLLITEAEKAAKALEAAAVRSPLARASLIETRKLIAEAIQSIEIGQIDPHGNGRHPSIASMDLVNHVEKEDDSVILGLSQTYHGQINGMQARESLKRDTKDFDLGKFNFQDLLNGEDEVLPEGFRGYGLLNGEEEFVRGSISNYGLLQSELDNIMKQSNLGDKRNILPNGAQIQSRRDETSHKSITVTKKWVRGRLVEVVEEDTG